MIHKCDAAVLRSLREHFNVDTTPAEGLTGPELQAWIDAADEALFLRLMAELAAQTADRELARDELAAQYEIWRKAL